MAEETEEKNIGFRIPINLLAEVDGIGKELGLNRTSTLILACREFIDRRKNKDWFKDQMRQALLEDPSIMSDPLQRIGLQFFLK